MSGLLLNSLIQRQGVMTRPGVNRRDFVFSARRCKARHQFRYRGMHQEQRYELC